MFFVSQQAGLSIARSATFGNSREWRDEPSPVSVLETSFDEDDGIFFNSSVLNRSSSSSLGKVSSKGSLFFFSLFHIINQNNLGKNRTGDDDVHEIQLTRQISLHWSEFFIRRLSSISVLLIKTLYSFHKRGGGRRLASPCQRTLISS